MRHKNQEDHEQQGHHEQPEGMPHQALMSKQSPVITWEQPIERKADSSSSKVIDIDAYRRQDATTIDTEATTTVRELTSLANEEPVRLIIISSGFGQKHAVQGTSVQCKVA